MNAGTTARAIENNYYDKTLYHSTDTCKDYVK